MKKIVHPFNVPMYKNDRMIPVFCEIEYTDGKLSISGVIGPLPSGNARGGCGQIIGSFKEYDDRGYLSLHSVQPGPNWNRAMIRRFLDTWDRWHLNNMKAGCEHQRALGWDKIKLDDNKPVAWHIDKHANLASWAYPETWKNRISRFVNDNKLIYAHLPKNIKRAINKYALQDTHPRGVLCKPCPVCGYKYGSAWKREEVPADVIDWLTSLPDTDRPPAWV